MLSKSSIVSMITLDGSPLVMASLSKEFLASRVESALASCINQTLSQSVAVSTNIVAPHIRACVGEPFSCGTSPGCAETNWSVQTLPPRVEDLGFLMVSPIFLDNDLCFQCLR